MADETQLTPMMAQYRRIKSELPKDALLLFRLGDFYEMFFEDAQVGSQILNVALTKRGIVPMCGIPFHAAPGYISKILLNGRKVAICEQTEEARPGQLVKREVSHILSPGTHFDERILVAEKNNFLASIYQSGSKYGLAYLDLTTSEFKATQLENEAALLSDLERVRPSECIHPQESQTIPRLLRGINCIPSAYEDWVFAPETAQFTLRDHFKTASLDGFGLREKPVAIGAAGALIHYLLNHLRRKLGAISRLNCYESSEFLTVDLTTLRGLEILEPLNRDAARNSSLYSALNRTMTPLGARKLREWLTQPLAACERIRARQSVVQAWVDAPGVLEKFRVALKEVRDLERTVGRLSFQTGNARDLCALRAGLEQLPKLKLEIQNLLGQAPSGSSVFLKEFEPQPESQNLLHELDRQISLFPELVESISRAIVDEPPLAIKEGGLIRDGFSSDLDEIRTATREGKHWIAQLQQKEIERTGISSLKIRFNSVFGYYIEVTKSNLEKVPENYIRKQTVANGERFITADLKEMEGRVLGAEERSVHLEYEIFLQVRETILTHVPLIQQTATALAELDVLTTFAETARLYNYVRPQVGDQGLLNIMDGRHPVLDQAVTEERFIANDVKLDLQNEQIALITGPNMAGKSTYIRQTALLALMAHTGAFVPAKSARIDLLDRIFTRIGASDDLSRGQSTFMVEMSETANILNNATQRSLLILDEIGRGTSTFDGLSLAWSIVEFLHNKVGAKTLFATHYHELTELSGKLGRVKNYNVAVREWNDQIVFLRKIVPGGTDKSYGIQVARLAGVPTAVLQRAREILVNLEDSELTPEGRVRHPARPRAEREKLKNLSPAPQLDLFAG